MTRVCNSPGTLKLAFPRRSRGRRGKPLSTGTLFSSRYELRSRICGSWTEQFLNRGRAQNKSRLLAKKQSDSKRR